MIVFFIFILCIPRLVKIPNNTISAEAGKRSDKSSP